MYRITIIAAATLFLVGCQTTTPTVSNTAAPSYVSIPADLAAAGISVRRVEAIPQGSRRLGIISTLACQKLTSDPLPTEEYALALLKKEAASRGATAISNVTYTRSATSITGNCWSNIQATAEIAIL